MTHEARNGKPSEVQSAPEAAETPEKALPPWKAWRTGGKSSMDRMVWTDGEATAFTRWLEDMPAAVKIGFQYQTAKVHVELDAMDWMRVMAMRQARLNDGDDTATIDEVVSDLVTLGLDSEFDGFVP